MSENKFNCAVLTAKMLSVMEADNYSYRITHRSVNYIYRALNRFCDEYYNGIYSPEAGQDFLRRNEKRIPPLSSGHINTYKNSIARLDHALNGDYHWKPVSREKKEYASSCFNSILKEYEDFLYQSGKTAPDIRNRIHVLARFLCYAEQSGVVQLPLLTAEIIESGFINEGSKDEFCKSVKSFFRYAYRRNMVNIDFSELVPKYNRHKAIPTVYSADEINTILKSIDRTTHTGKRNYCIVLIASRLGLRSCDIAGLTFSSINYTSSVIQLIQKKTGEPLEFPLLPEIKESLEDYIKNARPISDSPYIFLTTPQPDIRAITPHAIYVIVSRVIDNSGIKTFNKKRGAHALRSSLASQLLEEGNSYSIIQKVLGHTSPEAAKAYVRIEIEKLRECALPVPDISSKALSDFFGKAGDLI